ncbi:baseplate J/gp47 family protein [Halomonas sp. BL6]|uniref:baseplate assembly protein n=1 Tax=Halomonas sp. BL6 TaxID=2585770 RepID=UPI00111B9E4E|nr:baseplate J/gp47 family protein [Halomonas sp. BL6]TNH20012.1 baseplate assembly protein [Halomonas sp. BL6]
MNNAIDLSQLPAPNVIEPLDYETILAERKARLIALHPEEEREAVTELLALESEPTVKLLQENAYRELLLRQRINEAARAVMIAFANDEDLDQLGANLNVKRLVLDAGDPTAIPPVPPTLEKNRDYRARIQLAFEGLSVAGPSGAYEYQAISAHPSVLDVSVASPEPVEVVLTILSREAGGQPSQAVLDAVRKRVDERRPLTDRVTVQAATLLPFSITAVLALRTGPDPAVIREQARQQLAAYVEARHRLGAWITRSGVHAALTVEGVERITLDGFSEILAAQHQAPHCTGITLHTEGV